MNSTKRAIQTTFIDLYRKKSYDQMNVKELCVQTPVARTTFYEYYDNLGTLKAEIEDELIGGILKIAKATAGGSFVEMNLNVFFAQTLDYIKSHWEENYAFLVAQPNLAYIAKWRMPSNITSGSGSQRKMLCQTTGLSWKSSPRQLLVRIPTGWSILMRWTRKSWRTSVCRCSPP